MSVDCGEGLALGVEPTALGPGRKEGVFMGFLDDAKAKVAGLIHDNPDKVEELSDQGIEKAGEFAESKGLDADKVQQGKDFLDSKIGE